MTQPTDLAADRASFEEVHFQSGPYRLFGKLRVVNGAAPTILLLHGLGFHSFEYDALASLLARYGFNSLAFDHRCHGRSEGPRGYWTLQDLAADAASAIEFTKQHVRGPIGIFGNSMGAIVGIYAAASDARVKSLVVSSCPTRVTDFAATPFRIGLLRLLRAAARVVPFRVSVNYFIPYRRILLNRSIIKRVRRDPLITDARRFAPSTYEDIFNWNAMKTVSTLGAPMLVLYARHDGLQPPEQSIMVFEAARCKKEIKELVTGHVPDLENPELLGPILKDWFGRTLH
jgi:alpha-beta hydrolase superfamily lysophospholipase